jgi:homoserine O-succinyltransferase/O-acetyltransferase
VIYFVTMPIIASASGGDQCLYERLEDAGVPLIDETAAKSQDIRPARIGIMNLMPAKAMEATETQWLRWIGSQALLQIEPVLIKFDGDKREEPGASRQEVLKRYTPFSEVAEGGLDGLIITGDNLEIRQHEGFSSRDPASRDPLPFDEIRYYEQLREVIDWAENNVASTIYSCLAAHFALNYRHGLVREIGKEKIFGVFDHEVMDPASEFMRGMNDSIRSPHSRWGNTPAELVEDDKELRILAASARIGWLAVERFNRTGGTDLFLQGHPEYGRFELHSEYERDKPEGRKIPENYYTHDSGNPSDIRITWSTDARVFHENWVGHIYSRFSQPNQPTVPEPR